MRELAEVVPGVLIATAPLYTTTSTVLVGSGGSCLVVDPAVTVEEVNGLASELAARGLRAAAGWATHAHWDHLLWCAGLGAPPRYATPAAAATAEGERASLVDEVLAAAPGHNLDLFGRVTGYAAEQIPWRGPAVIVLKHDAHAIGHGALFLPDTGTLLAGDMLSDLEIPLIDGAGADPVGQYRSGLELLAGLSGVQVVVPGHGHVGDATEFRRRVKADLRYLDALERGTTAAASDERINSDYLLAEHDRQFAMLHG